MLFLIEYDRTRGLLASLTSFDSAERKIAEDARLALEIARNRSQRASEIVLLEAPTEEALRRTHRRYFEGVSELAG
jgi:hypothetical protein